MISVVFVSSALNISKRQSIVRSFQEYPKIDEFDSPYIIVSILRLMGAGITLTRAYQLVITNPEYSFYPKALTKKRISRISQLNTTTTHFLICWDVDIEKKIKERHKQRESMAKATVRKQK